jgi:hypothetical protein
MARKLARRIRVSSIIGKNLIHQNNMPTDYIPPAESSINQSPDDLGSQEPLLPRLAWNSQIAYLRVIFKAKKALDRIEKEAGIVGISN